MPPTVFTTDRLIVRQLDASDLDALYRVYSDPEAMRWVGDGVPITQAECEAWVTVTLNNYANRGYGMFALVERATGQVIGFGGIVHPGGQAEAEIKYAFRRDQWGRGLATETVRGLIDYGSAVHKLNTFMATVAPDNVASQRVLLKAGMRKGALRDNDDGSQTQLFYWQRGE